MNIYIDNVRMDTDERTVVSINLAIASISEPEKNRTGYSNIVILPVTQTNSKVMGNCDQVNSADIFNHSHHPARVEKEGCIIIEGVAILLSSATAGSGGNDWPCYRIGLLGSGKRWADTAAATMIRSLGIDFKRKITASLVLESWTWDEPVRFLPVQRDGFGVGNFSSNLVAPLKVLTFEDYHPFLHLRSLMDRIFGEAGYRLRSEFMDTIFFRKLYISGNYTGQSSEAAKARMDFRAGRFSSVAATADPYGIVYSDPSVSQNTIGNIVETADPEETRHGEKISGLYNNGGCFTLKNGHAVFVPLYEVTAAFEYRIYYTTDYYISDRVGLKGFNSVFLDDGQDVRTFALTNRYADRRETFINRKTYTLIVFGHLDGSTYRFAYDEVKGTGEEMYVHSQFSARSTTVTVNSSYDVSSPSLYIQESSGTFVPYDRDWALYDGYVEERGTMEVELRIRSAAERLLPSRPKYFDGIYFGGAEPGMNFTLGSKTTVRPVFAEYPTIGSAVEFEDVAAQDFSCLDLVKSVKHLFNLRFYTDEVSRNVYAEPYTDFYCGEPVTDWSGKIDLSKPVTVKEPAEKMASTIHYCYQSGDGSVTRRNRSKGETLGKWTVNIENNLARGGERTVMNGLFTASVNSAGDYPDAPDASLVQAGDREATVSDDLGNLNFPPKIVMYQGMRPLPPGQNWGWPAAGTLYPYMAFIHSDGDNNGKGDIQPFSLCFEDRDGVEGLHIYRDKEVGQMIGGRRVELYVNLSAADIEPFVRPNSQLRDFRGMFRLTIDGEAALYRLEEISGFNPSSGGSTKCVFLKEYPSAQINKVSK